MHAPVKRTPFFYGWVIVGIATLYHALHSGIGIWALAVAITPMETDLEWTRSQLLLVLTFRAIVRGVASPILGPWVDRKHGAWVIPLISGVVLSLVLISMRNVSSLPVYYLLLGFISSVALLGMGPGTVDSLIPKWFIRKRPLAIAITSSGGGLGALLFSAPVAILLSAVGWRDMWLWLGVATLVVTVPTALLLRRRPEDLGLLPDGANDPRTNPAQAAALAPIQDERSFTVREVLRTKSFWLIILAFALATLSFQGFLGNLVAHIEGIGFTPRLAATAITVYGVFSIASRFIWAGVASRFDLRKTLMAQALLTALAMPLLLNIQNTAMLFIVVGYLGITIAGNFLLQPLTFANYFGRHHIGAVRGVTRPFLTLSTAASPLLIALSFDATNSNTLAFSILAFAWVLVALTAYLLPPSQHAGTGPLRKSYTGETAPNL